MSRWIPPNGFDCHQYRRRRRKYGWGIWVWQYTWSSKPIDDNALSKWFRWDLYLVLEAWEPQSKPNRAPRLYRMRVECRMQMRSDNNCERIWSIWLWDPTPYRVDKHFGHSVACVIETSVTMSISSATGKSRSVRRVSEKRGPNGRGERAWRRVL